VVTTATAMSLNALFFNSAPPQKIHALHASGIPRHQQQRFEMIKQITQEDPQSIVWFMGTEHESKDFLRQFPSDMYPTMKIVQGHPTNLAEHVVCMLAKWKSMVPDEKRNMLLNERRAVQFHHIVQNNVIPRLDAILHQIRLQGFGTHILPFQHRYPSLHHTNRDQAWTSAVEHDILHDNIFDDVQKALFQTTCGHTLLQNGGYLRGTTMDGQPRKRKNESANNEEDL
jgi:hypothetical protein